MPYFSFSPDLSFLNKKIDVGFRAKGRPDWRGEEQTTDAQVANAGNIIHALTTPIDPKVSASLDASSHPSGIGQLRQCGCNLSPQSCGPRRAAEKTNDPPSIANDSRRIRSEQSGKDLTCHARFFGSSAGCFS